MTLPTAKPAMLCLYHDHCTDGFTAAWVVYLWGQNNNVPIEFKPVSYGGPIPDVGHRDVLMVDFSYPMETLNLLAPQVESLLILDHHKTAAEALSHVSDAERWPASWRDHWRGGPRPQPFVQALFDMERSGAQLAWDYLFYRTLAPMGRPKLVDYVADRDLWQWKLHRSHEVNEYIQSFEHGFDKWNELGAMLDLNEGIPMAVREGESLLRSFDMAVRSLLHTTRTTMRIGGYDVPVCNVPHLYASEVGNRLAKDALFAGTYFDTDGWRMFSLRSAGDFDVSAVAKLYGGGGHAAASGFRMPLDWRGDTHAPDGEAVQILRGNTSPPASYDPVTGKEL